MNSFVKYSSVEEGNDCDSYAVAVVGNHGDIKAMHDLLFVVKLCIVLKCIQQTAGYRKYCE